MLPIADGGARRWAGPAKKLPSDAQQNINRLHGAPRDGRPASAALALAILMLGGISVEPIKAGATESLQPAELVARLGDDSFQVRQQASRELEKIGRSAKQALLAGLNSRDPEIRSRCRRLLAVALDLDLQARLAAFQADQENQLEHDLPGWKRHRELVGDSHASRELFIEMLRAEPHLFEAAEGDRRLLGALLQNRCEQLQQSAFESDARNRRLVSVGSVAALFFIGSHPDVMVTDSFVSYLHTFSYQPTFRSAMQHADKAAPLRKILGLWISRAAGPVNSYQNFMLSLQFGLKEGLAPAVAMLRDGAAQPHMAQYAMLLIGRFGGKEGIPLLLPYLKDQNLLGSYSINDQEVRTELRDVALSMLVHLTGQDHTLYGFEHLQKNPEMVFQPVTAGFTDPLKREAAFRRWEAWAAMNLKEANLKQGLK